MHPPTAPILVSPCYSMEAHECDFPPALQHMFSQALLHTVPLHHWHTQIHPPHPIFPTWLPTSPPLPVLLPILTHLLGQRQAVEARGGMQSPETSAAVVVKVMGAAAEAPGVHLSPSWAMCSPQAASSGSDNAPEEQCHIDRELFKMSKVNLEQTSCISKPYKGGAHESELFKYLTSASSDQRALLPLHLLEIDLRKLKLQDIISHKSHPFQFAQCLSQRCNHIKIIQELGK